MPTAILRNARLASTVDREKGIVFGCRLAEVGKLAQFADGAGNPCELNVTPDLIDSLLALWSERERGTAHWTHDWMLEPDKDPLNSVVATWRNFRKDESGNLVADAFLWPSEKREAVLYAAENDPLGMMVSMVFDYSGGKENAVAKSVASADFVQVGAATTALCAKLSQSNKTAKLNMLTPEDIQQLIADPAFIAAVKNLCDASDTDDTPTDEQLSALESDAGVTDADKKKEDDTLPAAMRSIARIGRAALRNAKGIADEAAVKAEARFTSKIGNGKFVKSEGDETAKSVEAILSGYMAAGAPNRATAILRFSKDKPKEYNAAREAGKL